MLMSSVALFFLVRQGIPDTANTLHLAHRFVKQRDCCHENNIAETGLKG